MMIKTQIVRPSITFDELEPKIRDIIKSGILQMEMLSHFYQANSKDHSIQILLSNNFCNNGFMDMFKKF